MEELKKIESDKDVELLSEEVQDVMNRIPSVVTRWGMTIMAIILGGILIATTLIKLPKTIECPFEGQQIGDTVVLKTTVSSETLNNLLHRDEQRICIYSPMFEQKYSSDGIIGDITAISTFRHSNDHYNTTLTVVLDCDNITTDSIFYGEIQFTISEKTLLQSIVACVKRW